MTDTERVDAFAVYLQHHFLDEDDLTDRVMQIQLEAEESGTEATDEEVTEEAYKHALREMIDALVAQKRIR